MNLENSSTMEHKIPGIESFDSFQYIGRGACAIVRLYDENTIIKKIFEAQLGMYDIQNFQSIIGIKNKTCVFPTAMHIENNMLIAFLEDYVKGDKFIDAIDNIDFETLYEDIYGVEEDLKKLSEENVIFRDFNYGGILYNSNGDGTDERRIRIVDTDFFDKNSDITPEKAYRYNLEQFYNEVLVSCWMLNGQMTNISMYLQTDQEYQKKYKKYFMSTIGIGEIVSVAEIIKAAVASVENYTGTKIHNIGEMKKILSISGYPNSSNGEDKLIISGTTDHLENTFQNPGKSL